MGGSWLWPLIARDTLPWGLGPWMGCYGNMGWYGAVWSMCAGEEGLVRSRDD